MTQTLPNPSGCIAATSLLDRCSTLRLGRHNLFDVIRLYAAMQVMIGHGVTHLHFTPPLLLASFFSLPGVPLFFSISGFLVGWSSRRFRGRWVEYAWHRMLRVFPALWICLFFSILALIAFGKAGFFLSPSGLAWLFCQATVFQFFNPSQLRDFGVGVVNGSLWTIPVELQFYTVLPVLVTAALRLRRRGAVLLFVLVAFSSFFLKHFFIGSVINSDSLSAKLLQVSFAPHLFQFLLGFTCLFPLLLLGRKRTILVLLAIGLMSLFLSGFFSVAAPLLKALALAFLPVGIGLIPVDLLRGFDVSYGLYLYHMPVANILLAAKVSSGLVLGVYFMFSFLIAAFSWLFVEKRALSLKSKIPSFLLRSP